MVIPQLSDIKEIKRESAKTLSMKGTILAIPCGNNSRMNKNMDVIHDYRTLVYIFFCCVFFRVRTKQA
jgi:hypothetical protein